VGGAKKVVISQKKPDGFISLDEPRFLLPKITARIVYIIPSPIHGHIIRFLINALNNSIGETYGTSGLDVQPRRG